MAMPSSDAPMESAMADNHAPLLRTPPVSRPARPLYHPPQRRDEYSKPHGRNPYPPLQSFPTPPPPVEYHRSFSRLPYNPPGYGARSRDSGGPANYRRRSGSCWDTPEPNPFQISDQFAGLGLPDNDASVGGDGGAINFEAYEDIPVQVSGEDVPPPAANFAEIDLGSALNLNIKRCKYVKPTPVQRYAIPILIAGRDLMACAQTGSGKTAAFCLPIICNIMRQSPPPQQRPKHGACSAFPKALILSPTRELAIQIHEEAKKFGYQTGIRVVVLYGGTPVHLQLRELQRGVDILVATPGRLVDLMDRSKVSLNEIKYLTLDEADRMLDMGFEPQIRKIVQQMDMPPPGRRLTMLFSATFPEEIQRLASDFLLNYIFLAIGRVGSSTDLISQVVEFVPDMEKRRRLLDILHAQGENGVHDKKVLTLVFVETKRSADSLENWLRTNGFCATSIHGDRTQIERERALKSFKSGATPIMVATDVAARGLDVPHVAHVINFDLPRAIDDYVHRIGRTGRAGKPGLATAFFSDGNQSLAKQLLECMQEANQVVPDWLHNFADMPSYGGGRNNRCNGQGRFGGHDYRKDLSAGNKYNSSYGDRCDNNSEYQSYGANAYGEGCNRTSDSHEFQSYGSNYKGNDGAADDSHFQRSDTDAYGSVSNETGGDSTATVENNQRRNASDEYHDLQSWENSNETINETGGTFLSYEGIVASGWD
ncbi:hypothetical protein Cni_G02631 [Canna indica]|uniref:RNA helicase n=1 Tax=Canna indica TaxID=4628 RepID=A0AAQ3Q051_9LILI|nr:hypothetical protein Cni_G02631 [Canna indica]